jgi:DNA-binding CsgD family transcriptional regulator
MSSTLSPRQREILELVASGRTSKEIAAALGISESTVNWHLANVFAKLGASNRAEAVARAYAPDGNERQRQPISPSVATLRPRFIAITIAVAIAAALLGGATVATLRWGPGLLPTASPVNGTASPVNGPDRTPTSSPASGTGADGVGGEVAPSASLPTNLPLPAVSALPVPSVPVPLPTPSVPVTLPPLTVPSLPVTPPPLPSPSIPLPIPTPSLPIP